MLVLLIYIVRFRSEQAGGSHAIGGTFGSRGTEEKPTSHSGFVHAAPSNPSRRLDGKRKTVLQTLYPEIRFSRVYRADARLLFYTIVADLLKPTHVVLDYGAGRGHQVEGANGFLKTLIDFRARCARVVGTDPDPIVSHNPYLDEAHVMDDGRIPIPDESVDLIVSYAVLEHVAKTEAAAAELFRVLKPGGWFCAWTPNKWGYVGVFARLIPNRMHARIAKAAVPKDRRDPADVFPTFYRMNTLSAVRRLLCRTPLEQFFVHREWIAVIPFQLDSNGTLLAFRNGAFSTTVS